MNFFSQPLKRVTGVFASGALWARRRALVIVYYRTDPVYCIEIWTWTRVEGVTGARQRRGYFTVDHEKRQSENEETVQTFDSKGYCPSQDLSSEVTLISWRRKNSRIHLCPVWFGRVFVLAHLIMVPSHQFQRNLSFLIQSGTTEA